MDADSFHILALAELEAVHRLAFHLSRDRHEADDLVQETYLRAMRSAESFHPGEHGVRPWLFKILHNVLHTRRSRDRRARDALPRLSRGEMERSAAAAGSQDVPPAAPAAGVAPTVDWDGLDERLCRAIRGLPVAHRTVFLLASVEDMKYREIADVVGVPVGTVMSRLSRARAALAAQLGDLAAEQNLNRRPPMRGAPAAERTS
jgi:RNA polymerase sigma-70 factor (ECF subfamily)